MNITAARIGVAAMMSVTGTVEMNVATAIVRAAAVVSVAGTTVSMVTVTRTAGIITISQNFHSFYLL